MSASPIDRHCAAFASSEGRPSRDTKDAWQRSQKSVCFNVQTTPPTVGIGVSVGGLEAIIEALSHLPEATDMVYLVVQHLASDYESIRLQILARHTV